jgi:hypothetical protein
MIFNHEYKNILTIYDNGSIKQEKLKYLRFRGLKKCKNLIKFLYIKKVGCEEFKKKVGFDMKYKKQYVGKDENGNEWGIELTGTPENRRIKYQSFFLLNGKRFGYTIHGTQKDAETFWMLVEEILKKKESHEQNSN